MGFVLLPAVLLTVALQAAYLARKNMLRPSPTKAALTLLSTVLLGIALSVAAFAFAPAGTGRLLGIRDIGLFGLQLPVWPLGFALLAASAIVTTKWFVKAGKGAA